MNTLDCGTIFIISVGKQLHPALIPTRDGVAAGKNELSLSLCCRKLSTVEHFNILNSQKAKVITARIIVTK